VLRSRREWGRHGPHAKASPATTFSGPSGVSERSAEDTLEVEKVVFTEGGTHMARYIWVFIADKMDCRSLTSCPPTRGPPPD